MLTYRSLVQASGVRQIQTPAKEITELERSGVDIAQGHSVHDLDFLKLSLKNFFNCVCVCSSAHMEDNYRSWFLPLTM